jgi:hypothetical protein
MLLLLSLLLMHHQRMHSQEGAAHDSAPVRFGVLYRGRASVSVVSRLLFRAQLCVMVVCMVGGHMAYKPRPRMCEWNATKSECGVAERRAHGGRSGARWNGCSAKPRGVNWWSRLHGNCTVHLGARLAFGDLRGACAHADILSTGARADQSGSSKPFATVEYEDCMIDTFEAGALLYPHRGNQIERVPRPFHELRVCY